MERQRLTTKDTKGTKGKTTTPPKQKRLGWGTGERLLPHPSRRGLDGVPGAQQVLVGGAGFYAVVELFVDRDLLDHLIELFG
jgi:hypothetical protein